MELPILDIPFPEKVTPNKELINKSKDLAFEVTELKNSALELINKGIDEIEGKIKSEGSLWKADFEKHSKDYSEITAGHEGLKTRELNDQIELLSKKRRDVQSKLNRIDVAENEYKRRIKTRKEYISNIRNRKLRIAALRERKI